MFLPYIFFVFIHAVVLSSGPSNASTTANPPVVAKTALAAVPTEVRPTRAPATNPGYLFAADQSTALFPREGFEDRIEFWKKVFTRYGERDAVFHDRDDVRIIYTIVQFEVASDAGTAEWKRQKKVLERKSDQLAETLDDLEDAFEDAEKGKVKYNDLKAEHYQILDQLKSLGYTPSHRLFKRLEENVRYQRGIKEKFKHGLIRSGRYLDAMEQVMIEHGLPAELALLPHIESSFDYSARSSVGAVGIWQLMSGTAKGLLSMGRSVDERLDPLKATEAAAQILKKNHALLDSWPLAITAYNHGLNGMARAKSQWGQNLFRVIDNHESKLFGFASKNFYVEFLAAMEVARNYQKYFGPLYFDTPLVFDTIRLNRSLGIYQFSKLSGLPLETLKSYNPHLTDWLWSRGRTIPAGVEVRVPAAQGNRIAAAFRNSPGPVSASASRTTQPHRYRVRSGDTLIGIARRHGTSVEKIKRVNGIRSSRIYAGQVLRIPAD